MTNKTMLSVERQVIEDILADAREPGHHYMAARKVLRALLDKPVLKSWPCWSCKTHITLAERAEADGECPHCEAELDLDDWPIEPAAQHQGEPVAWVIGTADGNGADYYPGKGLDTLEIGAKLYAEQPAPVAVVMPELKTPYYKVVPTKFGNKEGFWQITPDSSIVYDNRDEAQARADARNASRAQHFFGSLKPCLEEVARLNGVKP